jgi:hypothetical protein
MKTKKRFVEGVFEAFPDSAYAEVFLLLRTTKIAAAPITGISSVGNSGIKSPGGTVTVSNTSSGNAESDDRIVAPPMSWNVIVVVRDA